MLSLFVGISTGAAQQVAPSTNGFYSFQISSRTFEKPFVGENATGRAHLLISQTLNNSGALSLWYERGFPSVTQDYGAELNGLPLQGGYARINLGDFLLQPLLPARFAINAASLRQVYPLRGFSFRQSGGRVQWNVFAGQARRFRQLPDFEAERPILVGIQQLQRFRDHHYGIGFTGVIDPTFVDTTDTRQFVGMLNGTYYRSLTPRVGLLGELHALYRGLGARAGTQFKLYSGEVTATFYAFGSGFPFVFPLYRPGENGITLSGRYQLTEFSSLFAHIDYVLATKVNERKDIRAEISYGTSLGSNRPYLYVSYSRNTINFDTTQTFSIGQNVDLLALSLTRSSASQLSTLRLEHLIRSGSGRTHQTRASYYYRRLLQRRSFLNATLHTQLTGRNDYKFDGGSTLERPLRRQLNYLVGLGVNVRTNSNQTTGEGLLRLGLSRRITRNGLSLRLETAIPFPIGLERSTVPIMRFSFDIGHRQSWQSLDNIQDAFMPAWSSRDAGVIEGSVQFEGEGVGRVTIYVNGEPRAITGGNGRFRVRRVPPGMATIRLDVREFEAEYGVVGGPARQVEVRPGQVTQVPFTLAIMRYLQGSILTCEGESILPLADVVLTLEGTDIQREVRTSRVGGFQFDELPPGSYELIFTPEPDQAEQLGAETRRWQIDLAEDLAGYLIRINCNE